MCERLFNTVHCLTFRQKEYKASKASGGGATAGGAMADEFEADQEEEEAISTQDKAVKIQSLNDHQRSKTKPVGPTIEKPKRSHSINKKVDDFIARTKMKIRSVSGINVGGDHHPT